jgi:hypothetical protein
VQRHHDAVVELPFLGEGDVRAVHHFLDQATREIGVAWHPGALDAQPFLVFDRTFIVVRHADRVGRHVVHEEVGEVLGGDDHEGVRTAVTDGVAHPAQLAMEAFAGLSVGLIGAAGDARRVAQGSEETEAHTPATFSSWRVVIA